MAKAILEFDLNDTDDSIAFTRCNKSLDMAFALWKICHNSRKGLLYNCEAKEMNSHEAVCMVFDRIYEIMQEHNVNLDELMN
jgi:hypothetical protein